MHCMCVCEIVGKTVKKQANKKPPNHCHTGMFHGIFTNCSMSLPEIILNYIFLYQYVLAFQT